MGKDCLVQTIVEDVENRGDDICEQAWEAVKEYQNDILEAFDEVPDLSKEQYQDTDSMCKIYCRQWIDVYIDDILLKKRINKYKKLE